MVTLTISRPTGYCGHGEWTHRDYRCPDLRTARRLARRRLGSSVDTVYGASVSHRPCAIAWSGDRILWQMRQPVEIVQSVGEIGVW